MGRPGSYSEPQGKVSLQRVQIDSGGYDHGGAYWGLGAPLWWACDEEGSYEAFLRASTRAHAKAIIRAAFPDATIKFYR